MGHTKFPPDLHIGIAKRRLRIVTVESLAELFKCVNDSSRCNMPILGEDVTFFDWKSFLGQVIVSSYFSRTF